MPIVVLEMKRDPELARPVRSGYWNQNNLTYSTAAMRGPSGQSRNSRILVKINAVSYAAQIIAMQSQDDFEATFVVKRFLDLSDADAAADPYRKLTRNRMWLVQDQLEETEIKVQSSSIMCHLVYCPVAMPQEVFLGRKLAVVASLNWYAHIHFLSSVSLYLFSRREQEQER